MDGPQAERLRNAGNVALIAIGVLAVFSGLWIAQSVFAPTILALVFGVVLSPLSDIWERLGLPRGLSALLSLVFAILLILSVAALALPATERIISAWPSIMSEVRSTIFQFQTMLQGLEDAGREVQEAIGQQGGDAEANGDEDAGIGFPTTADALFLAPAVLGQTITFTGVLFFFLLTRTEVYAWLAQHLTPEDMEQETARRLRHAERQVARYFLTISLVNLVFGACTALAMLLIGLPGPMLWGLAVFLLNFVLYLGPAIVAVGLLVAGIVSFEGTYALLPMATFICLNLIEAQFVTPTAIGKAMHINPLLVFFALVFFLWLWGPLGGFVSIPLLLWIMSLAQEITATRKALHEKVISESVGVRKG